MLAYRLSLFSYYICAKTIPISMFVTLVKAILWAYSGVVLLTEAFEILTVIILSIGTDLPEQTV